MNFEYFAASATNDRRTAYQERRGDLMNRRILRTALFLALSVAAIGPVLGQATKGVIQGLLRDKDHKPLAGAAVSITGSALQGQRFYLTESSGIFYFPELPQGVYELRAEMPGYKSEVRPGIQMGIGRTVDLLVELEASTLEEDTINAASSPAVDVSASKFSIDYGRTLLTALPLQRDFGDILRLFPGSIGEGLVFDRSASILGGTVRGQRILMDGTYMGDTDSSLPMVNINVDAIEEIEFIGAGMPAEIGQADGSLINIVTRTGGNAFEGGVTAYYTDGRLAKDMFSADTLKGLSIVPPEKYTGYRDFALNLAGMFWENRAWVYITGRLQSWEMSNPYSPESRMTQLGIFDSPHFDWSRREWISFFHVTVEPIKQVRYMGTVQLGHLFEPYDGASIAPNASSDYVPVRDGESSFSTSHQIDYIFNQDSSIQVRGIYSHRGIPLLSRTAGLYTYFDYARQVYWGASAYDESDSRTLFGGTASLTTFADRLLGASHEFKAGIEYEQGESHIDWYRENPYYSLWYDYAAGNPYIVDPLNAVGRLALTPAPSTSGVWDIQDNFRRVSAFFRDNLKTGRLALNLGLRFDYSFLFEPSETNTAQAYSYGPENLAPGLAVGDLLTALNDRINATGAYTPFDGYATAYKTMASFFTVSPRVGGVFDLFGDGKTALKASFSRYFESVWTAKYNAGQLYAPQTVEWNWYDLNKNGLMDLPGTDEYTLVSSVTQTPNANYYEYTDAAGVLHSLKAPYTDEITAGLEHELFKNFNLGLRFIARTSRNIVEDIDSVNGYDPTARDEKGLIWLPLTVTDPVNGQPITVYGLRADRPTPVLRGTNPSEAERKYWAFVLTFDKRMADQWQLSGSVTYSSFRGNVGAGTFETLGRTAMFNDPNSLTNSYGPLSFDRPLQVQLMAGWSLPLGFVLSAHYQYMSGAPYDRTLRVYFPANYMGYGTYSPYYDVIAQKAVGRYPAYSNLDLRLETTIPVGRRNKIGICLDVFNALGDSAIYYNLNPAGTLRADLPTMTYTNGPTYNQVQSVYGVRTIRFGLKYIF
jgi:hypothetical protein